MFAIPFQVLLLTAVLHVHSPLLATVGAESTDLSFIVKDKQFGIHTTGPSLCVVNSTLIQLSYNEGSPVYDVFAIEPDGSIDVITIGMKTSFDSRNDADITVDEASGMIIEVHSDKYYDLKYSLGRLNGHMIDWITPNPIIYASGGKNPSLSVAPSGIVISVHSGIESGELFYNLGRLDYSAKKNEWVAPVQYLSEDSFSPKVYIVNDTTVIETHVTHDILYYNIGEIRGTDLNTMEIKWHSDKWNWYKDCYGECGSVDLMVDPFGIVMVSFTELKTEENQLYYVTGVLNSTTRSIHWNDKVRYSKSPLGKTAITFLKDHNHIYIESHDSADNSGLKMNSLAFGVEIVDIEYKPFIKVDSIAFAMEELQFKNKESGELKQTWTLEQQYSCINTFQWETKLHFGISATAGVKIFGSGVSTRSSESLDFVVGHNSSSSTIFTWKDETFIDVEPNSGDVCFSAIIYREVHSVPFIATFQRGDTTWTEMGTVEVSHGATYSSINNTHTTCRNN